MSDLFNEASVLVGGASLDVDRKSVKAKLGSRKRDPKGAEGHYTTETVAGGLTFKLAITSDIDLDTVRDYTDKTVQVVGDNGLTLQSASMFTAEVGEPDSGYVEIKMGGTPFYKI